MKQKVFHSPWQWMKYFELMNHNICLDPVYFYVWRNIRTLDPCSMESCFDINSCFPTTTIPPSPQPTMSAHDQQAANHTSALPVVPAKSKSTSWKRQQSNADESATKHNKTVGNESDNGSAVEEANAAEKDGKKGKKTGAKGKKRYLFYFCQLCLFQLTHHLW